jgi:nucleotide-binding universal stress UspA family protein
MKIERILCPTDFSDCSRAALGLALELAQRLGASLRLVHVFQLPRYAGFEDGLAMTSASAGLFTDLRARADEQLRAEQERCRKASVTATAEQVEGVPYAEIVKLSSEADLVVMGTHGRTGLPRLVLGSVAERVVRLAKSPVLTVPAADQPKR